MITRSLLAIAVVASALFAAGVLLWLVLRMFAVGHTRARNGWKGVVYAFGQGMLPWEKESARRHGLTLLAGVLYHAGVFLALVQLFALIVGLFVPPALARLLPLFFAFSLLSGVGLLLKRAFLPTLRALSCPDDYAANLIVNSFLVFSFLASLDGSWINWLLCAGIAFFIYLPLGKVRHCVFFFYTRVLFGLFFGARGVLPHSRQGAK